MMTNSKIKSNIWLFYITVADGTNEYETPHVVIADNKRKANSKARKYAREYLGCPMKWTSECTLEGSGSGEYRIVQFNSVTNVSVETLLERLKI